MIQGQIDLGGRRGEERAESAQLFSRTSLFAFRNFIPSQKSCADSARSSPLLPPKSIWPWIIANALSGPALGVGCYQWALMQEKSGVVLPIVALTPLVIIPFSLYVEGEHPRKRSLLGGLVAVAGVVVLRMGIK